MDAIVSDILTDTLSGTTTKERVDIVKHILTKPGEYAFFIGLRGY